MDARIHARMHGYADGLQGIEERASIYRSDHRFAYTAGHGDGAQVRADYEAAARVRGIEPLAVVQ